MTLHHVALWDQKISLYIPVSGSQRTLERGHDVVQHLFSDKDSLEKVGHSCKPIVMRIVTPLGG